MLAETQWAQIFGAAKRRGARWSDLADVEAFKREVEAALPRELPVPTFGVADAFTPNLTAFFDTMREGRILGPTLSADEVSGCEAIIAACRGWPLSWTAYALATAYHETAGTMQPIKEHGGAAYFRRMYDPQGARPQVARRLGNTVEGDGVKFAGRGYVQLTGRANYARAQDKLGAPFVSDPDLAMQPGHAAAIMREGMRDGWFTGKSLKTYLPESGKATHAQFKDARRIINGTDRAADIATYAVEFQKGLTT
ncbi:hypothetical protein ACWPMX_07715 [Tsuneonella sp. HG094]